MSKIEYKNLLFDISKKINVNELPRLVFMCEGEIVKGSEANIQDVLTLFKELEKQNNLGIDHLDTLKELLTQIKKRPLLRKVEEFEIRRKAQSVGIVSSLKRAAACLKGAVKWVCNYRTIAGGLLVVGSTLALRSCSSPEEFIDAFNKVVLVASSKLVEISEGSLCFTVQAETPSALKELWNIYKNGTLQNRLQEFLVTEEIKQLASGEDIEVTVYMDEQEYKQAYLDLMLLETQVPDVNEEEQPAGRCRRNSDSFLCFKPNEDEVASMKLKHAENQLNFERQVHAEEVMKLKKEVAEAGNKSALGTEGLETVERPRERRRRNSDSDFHCKTRYDEIGESKKESEISPGEEAKYLDSEKLAFVQNYLQNIPETHSMTTETSDSGIRTLGEPSNIEMQDITYNSRELCLKDLSHEVVSQLRRSLEWDQVATRHICQSFGITGTPYNRRIDIFNLFPDTPVKLLKNVFEALQLYDHVDLLEKEKPQNRSLRIALPLQLVQKLKKGADQRPTTYHSSAAVLIIADERNNSFGSEGIRAFFKGLNAKSDITIIQCRDVFDVQEMKSVTSAASAFIERWIHNQGNFTLFAVVVPILLFDTRQMDLMYGIIEKLVSGIPDKIKFVIMPHLRMEPGYLPETLRVTTPSYGYEIVLGLMLQILNKRWRKLDLISMMEEFKRSFFEKYPDFHGMHERAKLITDHLTSLPRFKKEEDITD